MFNYFILIYIVYFAIFIIICYLVYTWVTRYLKLNKSKMIFCANWSINLIGILV